MHLAQVFMEAAKNAAGKELARAVVVFVAPDRAIVTAGKGWTGDEEMASVLAETATFLRKGGVPRSAGSNPAKPEPDA